MSPVAAFLVLPFVQSVGPTDGWVVWESDGHAPAAVEWSWDEHTITTPASTAWGDEASAVREVHLDGLPPGTFVTYTVVDGDDHAGPFTFRTAEDPAAATSVRLVAVSDMQRSSGDPEKWGEVVHQGIVAGLAERYGDDLAAVVDAVLIPGDLVDDGTQVDDWRHDFFGLSHPLGATVPFWPVPGNHEADAVWYQRYFHLPDNGHSLGVDRWWTARLANVRLIGLDSNALTLLGAQNTFLDETLAAACDEPGVDFVFVQLHHPARSEVWPAGNHPWAQIVDDRLDAFTAACGRVAVTLFGHTHAYSRGQVRDAPHLLVNVASAGGTLDRWGDGPQINEPVFSVSDDAWGWTLIEVTAGDDPTLTVQRFSLGDREAPLDNVTTDEVVVHARSLPPAKPAPLTPAGGEQPADCLTLRSAPFSDPDGHAHQASHWQVGADCTFSLLLADSWRQDHDRFYGADPQEADDLTDETVFDLPTGAACWRVRHRDTSLAWSDWSTPTPITLGSRHRSDELLRDGGAETSSLDGWSGRVEGAGDARCGAPPPFAGSRSFGLVTDCLPAPGDLSQRVELPPVLPGRHLVLSGAAWDGAGPGARLRLRWHDAAGADLGATEWLDPSGEAWAAFTLAVDLPADATAVTVEAEADAPAWLDALSLTVGDRTPDDCAAREAPDEVPAPTSTACGCQHPRLTPGAWLLAAALAARRGVRVRGGARRG